MKIIKIGAVWCSECLVMRPIWKKIETENPWLETEYYDYDERKDMVQKYNLENKTIPTFVFLDKEDNELTRVSGEVSEKELLELINAYKDK